MGSMKPTGSSMLTVVVSAELKGFEETEIDTTHGLTTTLKERVWVFAVGYEASEAVTLMA